MNKVTETLKTIIDREGLNYFDTNAYSVYKELLDKKACDKRTARLILITLLSGVQKQNTNDIAPLSSYIEKECFLKKSAADKISKIYVSLFSSDNCNELYEKRESGFREFCEKEWHYKLDECITWENGKMFVNESFSTKIDIAVSDKHMFHEKFKTLLLKIHC